MKKLTVAIFLFSLLLPIYQVFSQNFQYENRPSTQPAFFMPKSELAPKYERLNPIAPVRHIKPATSTSNTAKAQPAAQKRRASHYIAVDGRYIPVYDEEDLTNSENIEAEEDSLEEEDFEDEPQLNTPSETVQPESEPNIDFDFEPQEQNTKPEPQAKTAVNVPVPYADPINNNLPPYRNRYTQYLTNLQIFQRSKQMPYNPELEEALNKMSSSQSFNIFKGVVPPNKNKP